MENFQIVYFNCNKQVDKSDFLWINNEKNDKKDKVSFIYLFIYVLFIIYLYKSYIL